VTDVPLFTIRATVSYCRQSNTIWLLEEVTSDLFALAMHLKDSYAAVDQISADTERRAAQSATVNTCALSPYSHTYYYWYSITHSLFHSRLKSFLFRKSSLPQPFLFLLQDSLYGFPRLLLFLLSISVFFLFSFFSFLHLF